MGPQPFQVAYSQCADELLVESIRLATAAALRSEAIRAARVIERGLLWYADGLGESRGQLNVLGELRWVAILPLTAWFAVQHDRRVVWVNRFRFVPPHRRG